MTAVVLFVLAAVMSTPTRERAICDAGLKAFSFDSGLPVAWRRDDLVYRKASDEHGVLITAASTNRLCSKRRSPSPGVLRA